MRDQFVAQDHLVLALIKDPTIAGLLKEAGLSEATVKKAVEQLRGNRRVESKSAEQGFDALNKYAIDLTKLAEDGKLDPVIGRVCYALQKPISIWMALKQNFFALGQ
jgi:ATP-dependent Clp protease ATP-binding subunit ClpA